MRRVGRGRGVDVEARTLAEIPEGVWAQQQTTAAERSETKRGPDIALAHSPVTSLSHTALVTQSLHTLLVCCLSDQLAFSSGPRLAPRGDVSGQMMAMLAAAAALNAPALCMKLSSVHVRPDSQYTAGTFAGAGTEADAGVAATDAVACCALSDGGKNTLNFISVFVAVDWCANFLTNPPTTFHEFSCFHGAAADIETEVGEDATRNENGLESR